MKILKKISKVIVIVMAVLATIWCGLYVYANYFYNVFITIEQPKLIRNIRV